MDRKNLAHFMLFILFIVVMGAMVICAIKDPYNSQYDCERTKDCIHEINKKRCIESSLRWHHNLSRERKDLLDIVFRHCRGLKDPCEYRVCMYPIYDGFRMMKVKMNGR